MLGQLLNGVTTHPILGDGFEGPPGHISLAEDSPYIEQFATATQQELNDLINRIHDEQGVTWSLSGDRENRVALYRQNEKYMREGRTVHIGLDINAPAGTPLHAPLDATVVDAQYEEGAGNYGWMCVLRCEIGGGKPPFYLLFGHLAEEGLAPAGTKLCAGDVFAKIGDFHENGNWFNHTHLQVLTKRAFDMDWNKGLVRPDEVATLDEFCPSPMPLLRV